MLKYETQLALFNLKVKDSLERNKAMPKAKPKSVKKEKLEKKHGELLSAPVKVKDFGKKVSEKLKKEEIISAVGKAIEGFIYIGLDTSQYITSKKSILKKLQKRKQSTSDFKKIKKADIEVLDQVVKSYITENKIISLIEGGGTGLGGFTLILVDIPALFVIHLRLISQIALCYGYDINEIEERGFVLKILQLGYSLDNDLAKKAALTELTKAMKLISKGATWKIIEKNLFAKGLKEFTQKLGINLTKKKLSKLIPILGVGLSAGMNYKLTRDVGKTAYMEYRKRYLLEKKWSIRVYRFFKGLIK